MNKGQLIAAIEGRLGGKKAASDALEAVLEVRGLGDRELEQAPARELPRRWIRSD